MKRYDVDVKIIGIPEDKFDGFLTDIEDYVRKQGYRVEFGVGIPSEDNTDNEVQDHVCIDDGGFMLGACKICGKLLDYGCGI